MLVSDLQTGYPPMLHVWMLSIADMHASPPAQLAFIAMVEILKTVQIMQIPQGRRVLAVDLERVQGFVTSCITCRFESRQRSVFEAAQEGTRVIDADRFDAACEVMLTLFDEGFGHRDDFCD